MNILLVFPQLMDWFWNFREALRFIRKEAVFPPLGLMTVAALLPAEWNKRLVDLNAQRLSQQDFEWADYVFISAMFVQRDYINDLLPRCKKAGCKVVAGGPLFTTNWSDYPEVDHFVLNEAELTLPLFLADLKTGSPKRIYTTTDYPDMRQSPLPLWHLASLDRYDVMSIQYSRGCPNRCDFCNVSQVFGKRYRTKSAAQIIAELDNLYALGWRKNVYFIDDNLIGNKKEIKHEILPALIRWRKGKSGMPFQSFATIDLADDGELMQLMYEAGFNCVFVGIESPDEGSLNECNKYLNKNRDLLDSVRRIHRAGIRMQGGFIVGFDNDTPDIFQKQIDFIQESGVVAAKVNQLYAFQGTALYERLREEGRLRTDIAHRADESETTNIIPKMGLDVFQEGYRKLMLKIYSPGPYYERIITFLREFKKPKYQSPLELQYILAFFRSIYRIGMIGPERAYYWRLLFWAAFRRPGLLPMAVTLAVYGVHFQKVCERLKR